MSTPNLESNELKFLRGGGEMGGRIGLLDWTETPLGAIDRWPQSLKTTVSLMLNSQHPMWIGWGPEITFLYNDAYIPVLSAAKHPQALGQPTAKVWPEIWDICGPIADKVFLKGEASYLNDVRFFMNRGDFIEETFYSFSYSPIRDESGNVAGLFCPSAEVTSKVVSTRRLRAIAELAAGSLVEKTIQGACASASAILGRYGDDIPFVLLWLIDGEGKAAMLEQNIGIPNGHGLIDPQEVALDAGGKDSGIWPIAEVVATGQARIVSLEGRAGLPSGGAEQPIKQALVLPLASRGQERPIAVMAVGVNPASRLDADYRTFYELIAGHVATAIQNARAAEEEKKRVEMLAELDRAKTTFFSNVSHELRTPLTLMLGPLEDEMRESPVPRQRLELAHRNSLRLLKLVNTLLDFSRIEAGRVEASFEPVDLGRLTVELAGVFRSGIERAGLRLLVDCPTLNEPVYIDREMWEKIVYNLLSNALKFTAQGEIEVKLDESDLGGARCACLSVRDTGVGIAEAELPRVFERFHRTKHAWSRSHEGTGIGLALVQELARLHGGSVGVKSVVGRGTVFTVSIPLGRAHLPKERLAAARTFASPGAVALPFVEEAQRWQPETSINLSSTASNVTSGDGSEGKGKESLKPCILLADDNHDMRGYVHRLLAGQGYDVIAVGDGQTALEAVQARRPALVLSDVMMPQLDGVGLLRELRNNRATQSIPVILLSARAGEEARIEGVVAGADDYLTKPFSARELLARVKTHLELARVRREAYDAILDREERLRQALIEREKSEEKTRFTLDSITDGLHVVDALGRITYFNASASRLLAQHQQDSAALIGRDFFEVFPEVLKVEVGRAMKRTLIERVPTEAESFYAPWQKWFSVRHYPTAEGGVSTFFRDITESKTAEQALRESELKLRLYFDSNIIGNLVGDIHGGVEEANDEYLRIIGYSREELLTGQVRWDAITPVEFLPLDHQAIKRARQTGFSDPYEKQYVRKDGSRVWVLVGFVLYDEVKTVAFVLDISERKRAEHDLKEAHTQLADKATHLEALVQARTAKLRDTVNELEAFSYSIAHDMRAPLRSLQGFSDILLSEYANKIDEEGQRFLKRIAASAGRMDKLIQDVLNYSRVVRGELPMETVDLGQLIHGIIDTYPTLAPEKADIVLEGAFPAVLGNEAMLMQVFSNLMGNAVKFVSPGVKPRLKLWAEVKESQVKIFIQDNGIGIAPDQHEKIFAIFQQVNKTFEGTGIGLAIVKKAVERMGGKVGVQSELGHGCIFWMEITKA